MPPPSLSTRTIVADRPWRRAATSAFRSCRNDTSPTTSATGPTSAAAAPSAVETTPSMPFAPRFDSGRMARALAGQPVVHVADRHAVAGPQERAVGQELAEDARTAGLRTPRRAPRRRPASRRERRPRPGPPRTRLAPRRRSRAAPPPASCVRERVRGGGRVGLDERRRDDRRVAPDRGRRRPRSGRASRVSSRVSIGFEVVVAPNRMTRSGRWASSHGPGRTRWSAWLSTNERSCGPHRDARQRVGGDREAGRGGQAGEGRGERRIVLRTGDDQAAFRGARCEPRGPGPRPASRPLVRPTTEVTGPTGCPSSPRQRPERRPTGSSGSRNPMLRWTGPAGPPRAVATARPTTDRTWRRVSGCAVEQRQVDRPADLPAEDARLVDRLRRAAVAQLGRPVGGQQDERDARQRRLDDGRQQLGDGRPGRDDDRDRPPRGASQTQREEPRRRSSSRTRTRSPGWARDGQRERRRARPGTDDDVGHPARRPAPGRSPEARATSVTGRPPATPPSAAVIVRSLSRDSSHSRAGSESATIPQPANRTASRPRTSAQRSATISSPSPSAPEPADRARIPAAIEAFVLGDERERDVARLAADRRRRVEEPGERRAARPPRAASRSSASRGAGRGAAAGSRARRRRSASRRSARARRAACRRRRHAPRGPSRSRGARRRTRASDSASAPRGAEPAIATVSNDRPTVRARRSGVAPRNVVPPRA